MMLLISPSIEQNGPPPPSPRSQKIGPYHPAVLNENNNTKNWESAVIDPSTMARGRSIEFQGPDQHPLVCTPPRFLLLLRPLPIPSTPAYVCIHVGDTPRQTPSWTPPGLGAGDRRGRCQSVDLITTGGLCN